MAATTFDLNLAALKTDLSAAGRSYSPDEVREILLAILLGKNYRRLTEKATRLEISVFMSWVLNVCHRAKYAFGDEWLARLQQVTSEAKSREARWLRVWLLGLTLKTTQNLGLKSGEYAEYLAQIKADSDKAIESQATATSLTLYTQGITPTPLTAGDSVWLLQIAGAAVLTIRGSTKSAAGKLLEKAIARACLTALGLEEQKHFMLNLAADQEVERETDAEISTRRGRARMDVALIGTGNQEVSEDKLARVGKNGIVLVDKLGERSKVPANAQRAGVRLIRIQGNLPLSELYNHLEPLMPQGVLLKKPPTNEKGLVRLLKRLPDGVFRVPKAVRANGE